MDNKLELLQEQIELLKKRTKVLEDELDEIRSRTELMEAFARDASLRDKSARVPSGNIGEQFVQPAQAGEVVTQEVQSVQGAQPESVAQRTSDVQPEAMMQGTQDVQPEAMMQGAQDVQPEAMMQGAQDVQPAAITQGAQDVQPAAITQGMPDLQQLPPYLRKHYEQNEQAPQGLPALGRYVPGKRIQAQHPYTGQPAPEQQMHTGQPAPGQQIPGQQMHTCQPAAGQQSYSGQPVPGQQQYNGQPAPGQQQYSGQPSSAQRPRTGRMAPMQQMQGQKASTDVESTIGKQFMGVSAAVLIFIGIILFAMLIIPNLTDTLKMIGMFAVSFILTFSGLILLHRNKSRDFAIILTSCGMGAIYISLFMSALYFKAIDDIPLYLLLLIWIGAMCYLFRYRSYIFHLVGVLGIVISVYFGISILRSDDFAKTMFFTIYFMIGSLVFLFAGAWRKEKKSVREYVTDACGIMFSSLGMSISFSLSLEDSGKASGFILCLFLTFFIVYSLLTMYDSAPVMAGIFSMAANVMSVFLIQYVFDSNTITSVVCILFIAGITVFYIIYRNPSPGSDVIRWIWLAALLIILTLAWMEVKPVADYVSIAPFVMAVICYGFIVNDEFYKITGAVMMLVYSATYIAIDSPGRAVSMLILGFVMAVLPHIMMKMNPYSYHQAYKGAYYGIALYMLCAGIIYFLTQFPEITERLYPVLDPTVLQKDYSYVDPWMIEMVQKDSLRSHIMEMELLFCFLFASIVNSVLRRTAFIRDPDSDKEETGIFILTCAINAFLLLVGLTQINAVGDAIGLRYIYILVTLGLLFVNYDRISQSDLPALGIYLGARFTLYMIVCLAAFDAGGYVYSVACFILSIAGIIYGFIRKKKTVRIYFLVLSLLSVVKLIMFDMAYDNSIQRAGSFIASGVLCMMISLIYQMADKKMSQQAEDAQEKDEAADQEQK